MSKYLSDPDSEVDLESSQDNGKKLLSRGIRFEYEIKGKPATVSISPKLYKEPARHEVDTLGLEEVTRSLKVRESDPTRERQPVFPNTPTLVSSQQTVAGNFSPLPANAPYKPKEPSKDKKQTNNVTKGEGNSWGAGARTQTKFIVSSVNSSDETTLRNSQDHTQTMLKYPQEEQDKKENNIDYMSQYLLRDQVRPTQETKDRGIKAGEFPSYEELENKLGIIIYSTEENLCVGKSVRVSKKKIGSGGNGEVFELSQQGKMFAVKTTRYRKGELNVWSKLDHPNILPLLGVMMGDHGKCYQFMPLMTGNLRSMMGTSSHGDLYQLLMNQKQWDMILYNTIFILKEILKGLVYLDQLNIQHSDLKALNILVKKSCTCCDLLHCDCPTTNKFSIQISDFDSVKQTASTRQACQIAIEISKKKLIGIRCPKGTPAYRAPEQFKNCPMLEEFKSIVQDGKECYDMEGPWCDVWSLGVIILKMITDSHDKTYINKANFLSHCNADNLDSRIEANVVILRLVSLLELQLDHSELRPLAKVACQCLKINFAERPTASTILANLNLPPAPELYLNRET